MFTIKTLNAISPVGLGLFNEEDFTVGDNLEHPDALLVRSHDMHNMNIPNSVQVVGRAGAGTNNIPIDKLSAAGVPVMNTPGANANAVKELVITGMLLACRNICHAWQYVQDLDSDDDKIMSQTVEKNKNRFAGMELPGRTLGVIGLGNIGLKIANTALDLGMDVIGFDPAMTVKNAWQLSSRVRQAESVEEVIKQSDFLTLHIPFNDKTKGFMNAERLGLLKPNATLLNFARGGVVDAKALQAALDKDALRYYVCDFPSKALQNHPKVISLPHLGASTKEAEENCARMIASQVKDFLKNGNIKFSVNFPDTKMPRTEGYRVAIVNQNVPHMVAQISTVLSAANMNIIDMINKSRGELAYTLIDVSERISPTVMTSLNELDGVIRARSL